MRLILKRAAFNTALAVFTLGGIWLGGIALLNRLVADGEGPSASALLFMLILSVPLALVGSAIQLLLMALLSRTTLLPSSQALLRILSTIFFSAGFFAAQPARDLFANRIAVAPLVLALLVYAFVHRIPVSPREEPVEPPAEQTSR